ncbi:hypothetical protein G9F72_019360 [Clostridium estertheticum]|uniref:hypothetical protein n=1 Tax=Clostridium estertheticum TaxID=238834 RepID=UPI0013E97087|nr:hypothetical protein [Clostridium estertheticum]MBZ9688491.1 hypothetical protein [Clostridium estertheticum]
MVGSPCALCRQAKKLELSHIVPKFVIRYLKKTSVVAIRNMQNPNKVVQDGEKHYLLCGDCEDLFSIYETKFANTFFHPYMKDNIKEFNYDSNIYYFLTSVSWRSLYLDILDFVEHSQELGLDTETLDCLIASEKEMRNYLLKNQSTANGIEHHIFFFEDIKNITNELVETRPHTTFHRGIVSYTFFNKELKTYATITNMMGIILFTLYNKGQNEKWINTEIINGTGVISAENQIIESVCINELVEILNNAKKAVLETSDSQKEIINNRVKDKLEEFKNSKTFEDLKKDFNL